LLYKIDGARKITKSTCPEMHDFALRYSYFRNWPFSWLRKQESLYRVSSGHAWIELKAIFRARRNPHSHWLHWRNPSLSSSIGIFDGRCVEGSIQDWRLLGVSL